MKTKTKNIFWGILLILFGTLWILRSLNMITFLWKDFLHLWPLILLVIGVNLLSIKEWLKITLNSFIIVLGLILLFSYKSSNKIYFTYKECKNSELPLITTVPIDTLHIKEVLLSVNIGISEFTVLQDTNLLSISGNKEKQVKIEQYFYDSTATLKIEYNNHSYSIKNRTYCQLGLNPFPIWDLDFKMGVINGEMDLSPLKVRKINLHTGVSDFNLKFGDLYPETNVKINAGVSNINIFIPSNITCHITTESVLTVKNFDGFTQKDKHSYISEASNISVGNIYIYLNSGVSNIQVHRY